MAEGEVASGWHVIVDGEVPTRTRTRTRTPAPTPNPNPYPNPTPIQALYLQKIMPPHVPPASRMNTDFSAEVEPTILTYIPNIYPNPTPRSSRRVYP